MDTLNSSRQLVERILAENARVPYAYGDVRIQTVFDRDQDHYLLMLVGRDRDGRVHGCLVHVDIVDGKFWIQRDGTEHGIARDLMEAGVPKNQIVLAFRSPEARRDTEFAVV
jgi:hypothetical protein